METQLKNWCNAFVQDADNERGKECMALLKKHPLMDALASGVSEATISKVANMHPDYTEFLEQFLLMQKYSHDDDNQDFQALDAGCYCLKRWIDWYIDESGKDVKSLWMLPALQFFTSMMWDFCRKVDNEKSQENKYVKKLIEVFREAYRKLLSERSKMEGCVWITCELLRAYFHLNQIGQCPFLLKSLEQSLNSKGTFSLAELPKSIGVTFAYYWGRMCIYDSNIQSADEKLTWAFANTPPNMPQKRRILLYLIPCKLRMGIMPTEKLLKRYDLVHFLDICRAIRSGDICLFQMRMSESTVEFVKQGTFVLMQRLIHIVYHTLVRRVARIMQSTITDPKAKLRLDLTPFERALAWQDNCTQGETQVILSNLLYFTAIKGYLSNDHRKMVLAKDNAFPSTSKWSRF